MALLHAVQLCNVKVITTATRTTLYTVPAGYRVILRSVELRNALAGAQQATVWISGASIFTKNLAATPGDGAFFEWRPWLVMGPGDTLQGQVGSVTGVQYLASGSIYSI